MGAVYKHGINYFGPVSSKMIEAMQSNCSNEDCVVMVREEGKFFLRRPGDSKGIREIGEITVEQLKPEEIPEELETYGEPGLGDVVCTPQFSEKPDYAEETVELERNFPKLIVDEPGSRQACPCFGVELQDNANQPGLQLFVRIDLVPETLLKVEKTQQLRRNSLIDYECKQLEDAPRGKCKHPKCVLEASFQQDLVGESVDFENPWNASNAVFEAPIYLPFGGSVAEEAVLISQLVNKKDPNKINVFRRVHTSCVLPCASGLFAACRLFLKDKLIVFHKGMIHHGSKGGTVVVNPLLFYDKNENMHRLTPQYNYLYMIEPAPNLIANQLNIGVRAYLTIRDDCLLDCAKHHYEGNAVCRKELREFYRLYPFSKLIRWYDMSEDKLSVGGWDRITHCLPESGFEVKRFKIGPEVTEVINDRDARPSEDKFLSSEVGYIL